MIKEFNKINIDNIILNKIKTKDDIKIIDLKYKTDKTKDVCIFKLSNIELISNILYNEIRKDYIEVLINNIEFYNFYLNLENHIKTLLIGKKNKIFQNIDIDDLLIDELFKTNIKLSTLYNNPIFKLNIIKNTKTNNTLIYNHNKSILSEENLILNQNISVIIHLEKIIITHYTIEIILKIEQIKINKNDNDNIKRNLNEYNFDSYESNENIENSNEINSNEENSNDDHSYDTKYSNIY